MDNTEKLLRAFIEASGYDIEKTIDTKLTPISKQSGLNRITAGALTMARNNLATVNGNEYKRGDDECYYLEGSLDVDYKVTKKPQPCFDADSPEWACVVDYVLGARDEIELGINNFGDLRPILNYLTK